MTRGLVFTLWNTSFIIFVHLKLIKVHFLTLFLTFWSLNFSKWPKIPPSGTLPIPTNPQILGQPVQILKFRQKHMKVHKICYDLCPNRKKSGFWPLTPPYRLNQPTRTPTLTWKLVKWKKLNSRWCIWAKNWLRTRIWCILEIVVTDFQYFGFSPFRELFSAKISNFSLKWPAKWRKIKKSKICHYNL